VPVAATKRHARLIILLVLLAVGGFGYGLYKFSEYAFGETQEERFTQAKKEYEDGRYSNASEKFKRLETDYPESEKLPTYRFFKRFSDARAQVRYPQMEAEKAYDNLLAFLQESESDHSSKELMKAYQPDIRQTFEELIEGFVQRADQGQEEAVLAKAK